MIKHDQICMPGNARICPEMPGYARICPDILEILKILLKILKFARDHLIFEFFKLVCSSFLFYSLILQYFFQDLVKIF